MLIRRYHIEGSHSKRLRPPAGVACGRCGDWAEGLLEEYREQGAAAPHFLIDREGQVHQLLELGERSRMEGVLPEELGILFCGGEAPLTPAQLEGAARLLCCVAQQLRLRWCVCLPPEQVRWVESKTASEPLPMPRYRAELTSRFSRQKGERILMRLKRLGYTTPQLQQVPEGYRVAFRAHLSPDRPQRTVRQLVRDGFFARVVRVP